MEKKKNYGLFKLIGISFLVFVLLTWIIPIGNYSGGELVKGETSPLGIFGIFTTPVYAFAVFAQYFVLLLCIGGFYGVLNKTGVYSRLIGNITKKLKKHKNVFLISTIIFFGLITSLFNEIMMIFILLPLFVAILVKLGFNKITCLASTIGASLIGIIANISGNLAIYRNYFGLNIKDVLPFNIIMFVVLMFIFIMYIFSKEKKFASENKNDEKNDDVIPLYSTNKDNKKSILPLIIILSIVFVLMILGLYNWFYSFDIKVFNDLYEKIINIELFGTKIFPRIFGELPVIGGFTNYDLSAILVLSSALIAWIYSLKLDEFVESFKTGVKGMLKPAIYIVLASIIFSSVVTSSNGNISLTISDFFLNLSNDFNIICGMLSGITGSFFYNDFLYLINGLYSSLSLYNIEMIPAILFIYQSMFGIMMFILPVSITLICGLKFIDISYKDWIKYIWKFLIQAFLICVIASVILLMIV